jgi:hypothetical protein
VRSALLVFAYAWGSCSRNTVGLRLRSTTR